MTETGAATERVVYGWHAVLRAARAGQLVELYVQQGGGRRRQRLDDALGGQAPPVRECSPADIARIAGTGKHQGIAARIRAALPLDEGAALELVAGLDAPLLLILDGVQDPRNFGACLRAADGAGADLVVVARSRNAALTPVVSKVAAGAAETQPVAAVANLARFLKALARLNVYIVGLAGDAPASLYEQPLGGPVALVLGGEGAGLRRLTRDRCDALAALPMHGGVESLNVAVAAGICLYEAIRQRAGVTS